ncbi:MAG: hypothetical protein SGPRY_002638 [Prymnesium sp.]
MRRLVGAAALLWWAEAEGARVWRGVATMRAHLSMKAQPRLPTTEDLTDPRLWLEEVEGEESLGWVREVNANTLKAIGDPSSTDEYRRMLDILDSDEKIPYIGRVLNGLYYNFWQDENNVRGIWRRCTPEQYREEQPAWEVVLDLDALGKQEDVSWVWAVLDEGPGVRKDRVILSLSPGGSDATVAREFDLDKKEFVPASAGGFELPEAKSQFSYKDRDTLLVGGVFGEEEMTDSGYPRTVREWKRGTPLADAIKVYEGEQTDVAASGYAYLDRGEKYEIRSRAITFYTSSYLLKRGEGSFLPVAVPEDAQLSTFSDQLLITLRSSWLGFEAGSLLAAPSGEFLGSADDEARKALLTPLFEPTETSSLEGASETKSESA